MRPAFHIAPLPDLPVGVEDLRAEAAGEGFAFLDRLIAGWRSGANRFAEPGEVLVGSFRADDLLGIGGLSRDPHADDDGIGRLRHLYVKRSARRSGVGSALVRKLLDHAPSTFQQVRLRTDTWEAAAFYVGLGFHPVQDISVTHVMRLR